MNFTFIYVAFLIISTVYRLRRITKSYSEEPGPGKVYVPISYSILLLLYLLIWAGALVEYFYLHIQKVNLMISGIGFLMYVSVIPLRDCAAQTLGKYLSPDIKIVEGHKLIKEGPYKYIRHPLALSAIIEVVGITLIPNSYYSFLATLFIFLPYMLFRIHLEEKALTEKFGQEYIDYKKEVSAFLPFKKRISK
ncbi:MAG: isoprenylcysteine carboxylmethyltransferase family protein [bacterium]